MKLLDLPEPEVIEVFDFESIKQRKLDRVIAINKAKGIEYIPSESDDIMTTIEMDAYEEVLLRTRINNAAKSQLLAYAKKSDLDHIGSTRYGVLRLEGSKPYASCTFSLSAALTYDVTLPIDLQLSDGKGMVSLLLENVTIVAGTLSSQGTIELQEFIESSETKTEVITTPLPYIALAVQDENFHSGSQVENDDRYRDRIWLSREHKSTAGSKLTYEYFSKSADSRVEDVYINTDTAGVVKVYLLSQDGEADQVMINRIDEALNAESVRPLTDNVQVNSASIVEGSLIANIVLYDMSYEALVRELIEKRIVDNTMVFGKSLSVAKQYGILESEQVKDVVITNVSAINADPNEVIDMTTITLNFSGVA